jgi:hypothetical protein
MTALSWLYRPSAGFVLAADGKAESVPDTAEEAARMPAPLLKQQKIFAAEYKGRPIAYGITGQVFNEARTLNIVDDCSEWLRHYAAPIARTSTSTSKDFLYI